MQTIGQDNFLINTPPFNKVQWSSGMLLKKDKGSKLFKKERGSQEMGNDEGARKMNNLLIKV